MSSCSEFQRLLQASAESHTQQVNFTSTCLPVALSPGCLAFKFDEAAAACTLKCCIQHADQVVDLIVLPRPCVGSPALPSCQTHKASVFRFLLSCSFEHRCLNFNKNTRFVHSHFKPPALWPNFVPHLAVVCVSALWNSSTAPERAPLYL